MHRVLIVAAVAAASLLVPGAALAQDPESKTPPEFAPPAPAPVVDQASAEAFMERYAARNADRYLRENNRRRVRVIDANAACLEHPVLADRFGCVFTLRALVIRRDRGWDGWDKAHASGKPRPRPRFRVRTFGCLGLARIIGGPTVTPSVTVPLVECARVRDGDYDAPEPVL